MPGFLNENGTPTQRFSQHYANSLPHGRFNPNTMFSLTYEERRQEAHEGDASLPFLTRMRPLQFEGRAGNPFDGMPASGKVFVDSREAEAREDEDEKDEEEEEDEEDAVEVD
jgi:hypothetical protein